MNNILGLIGIARKAGMLEIGEEACGAAVRSHHAKALFIAGDAALNSKVRAENYAESGNIPFIQLDATKEEIGSSLGRVSCAMFALSDLGFAVAVVKKLAQQSGEYDEILGKLIKMEERAARRKAKKISRKGK